MKLCLINGQENELPNHQRALAYGDGLFETLRVEQGQIDALDAHLKRLMAGVQRLALHWPESSLGALRQQLLRLCSPVIEPHVLKVMLLRNVASRGYGFDDSQTTDVVISIAPYQSPSWQTGARLKTATTFATLNPSLAGLKHLNRLDSVLARASVPVSSADEVLVFSSTGQLIEGSMSNVFLKINGQWRTPSVKEAGVAGIMRAQLIDHLGQQCIGELIHEQVRQAQAGFITNSLIGVVPIIELNGHPMDSIAPVKLLQQEMSI